MKKNISLLIKKNNHKRLDQYLSEYFNQNGPHLSRSSIEQLFKTKSITLEQTGQELKRSKMPPEGSIILIEIQEAHDGTLIPENIDLDILFEDEHLLIINKPQGMVVHPAPGHPRGTLVNALKYHYPDIVIGDTKRPGIVHRLDRGTSGVMVVAKNQITMEKLVQLFSAHDLHREYECFCIRPSLRTQINQTGTIETLIGRHPKDRIKMHAFDLNSTRTGLKKAITHYKVEAQNDWLLKLRLILETGRTHQIRVHLSTTLSLPIFMDELYANVKNQLAKTPAHLKNQMSLIQWPFLHARKLEFTHPMTKKLLSFSSFPPKTFEILQNELSS